MNPDFFLWPLALVLLWTPSAVMISARMRERLRHPARRRDEGIVSLLRSPLNWIDLLRAAGGAWLVQREVHGYLIGQDDIATVYTVIQYSVLSIAVLAQVIWIDRPVRVVGPAFFLTGLTFIVCGPTIGGFALLLGFTCALMLRRLSLGFVFVPSSVIGFAMFFQELSPLVLLNSVLFALPMILAFAFGVRLAYVRCPADEASRRLEKSKDSQVRPALPESSRQPVPGRRIRTARDKAAYSIGERQGQLLSPEVIDLEMPAQVARR
jgi:hypothetical protein